MKRFCLALDLVDDPELIKEYERWHQSGRPEISRSIRESGITQMEIYRTGNRLFMIIEAENSFSFERKSRLDATNPDVQAWESLMWKFQKPLPWAEDGQKWILMNKIFQL